MEILAIRLDGEVCGELCAEEWGLYVRYMAVCRLAEAEPVRLFAVGERGELRLGVLQPENGCFVLRRQLSAREVYPVGKLLRAELRRFSPEAGTWREEAVPEKLFNRPEMKKRLQDAGGALVCQSRGCCFLAFPFDTGKPFPVADLFCFACVRRIRQREYAVFCFDGEEQPVLQ